MAYEVGLGSQLYYGTAGMTASTEITGVKKITVPGFTTASVDVTPLNPTDRTRTFKPASNDPGELKFTVSFDGTIFSTLYGFAAAGTTKSWKVLASDTGAATWECDGFITSIGDVPYELDGEQVFDVTVKWSAKPTFTA